jgi:hypothetical protein
MGILFFIYAQSFRNTIREKNEGLMYSLGTVLECEKG